MNYQDIVDTLISVGWKKDLEGTQYERNVRFKVPTEDGWEYFYVHIQDGYAYLCLHTKFEKYAKDFRDKSIHGISLGGIKNGQRVMRSSNMTYFEKVPGRTTYNFFPIRFQRKSDLIAAIEVIAEKAGFSVRSVQRESPSEIFSPSEGINFGSQDSDDHSKFEEVSDPPPNHDSFETNSSSHMPLSPEMDEERRKKQAENGALGEQIAMRYEVARLAELGCPNPIDCVQQVSLIDVGAGFDIHSSWNGEERFIEVKASQDGADYFFISVNELNRLQKLKERGWIYRVDLSKKETVMDCIEPISNASAELSKTGVLEAIQFKATILR
jgi:hypothetical protein